MQLGSTRHSVDTDYLVFDSGIATFSHIDGNIDLINAAGGNEFFAQIWANESGNIGPLATPQSLLELKAYAFAQHCKNGFWQKADDCEYDIKFLVRNFNLSSVPVCEKHLSFGEVSEINKVIKSAKK